MRMCVKYFHDFIITQTTRETKAKYQENQGKFSFSSLEFNIDHLTLSRSVDKDVFKKVLTFAHVDSFI